MPLTQSAPARLGNLLIEHGYFTARIAGSRAGSATGRARQQAAGRNPRRAGILHRGPGRRVPGRRVRRAVCQARSPAADPKIVDFLPREYIEKNLVLPLFCVRDVLTVAVAEPSNLFLIDEMRGLTQQQMQIVAATPRDIRRMITELPNSKVFVIDDIIEDYEAADVTLIEEAIEDIGDVEEIAGQSPVIRLVNYIIYNAVKEGASDIHIEPAERCLRVRYRIDGRLYKSLEVPLHLLAAVTSRIKIMAVAGHQRAPPAAGRPRARAAGWPQDRPARQHVSQHAARRP